MLFRSAWDKSNRLAGRLLTLVGLAGLVAVPMAPQPVGFHTMMIGIVASGLVPGRPDDSFGAGLAWARISERVKDDPRMIRQNGEDYAAVLRIIADAVTEIVTLTLHEYGY